MMACRDIQHNRRRFSKSKVNILPVESFAFAFRNSIIEKLSPNYFIFKCQVVTNYKNSGDDGAKIRI